MKVIGAVTIGKLIEAHYEKDEHKFKSYAEFITTKLKNDTFVEKNIKSLTKLRSNYV